MSDYIQDHSEGGSVNAMQPSAAMLENMRSTVPQLLDASAAQYGDKILIDFFNDDRTLSYKSSPSNRESWRIAWFGSV